jgi:hypothetical protein
VKESRAASIRILGQTLQLGAYIVNSPLKHSPQRSGLKKMNPNCPDKSSQCKIRDFIVLTGY